MNKENRAIIAFNHYFCEKEGNKIHYYGNENNVVNFLKAIEECSLSCFDAPDFYLIDKNNKTVFIIEHFEFDSFKNTRKGSSCRIKENDIDNRIKSIQKEKNNFNYHGIITARSSYEDYILNAIEMFNKHYEQIPSYINNVKDKCSFDNDWRCVVCFFIEDVSPFGTQVYDEKARKIEGVNLAASKEFLSFFIGKKNVDCVISCSSYGNENEIWFIDRDDIGEYLKESNNYSKMRFLDWHPNVVYVQRKLAVNKMRGERG